MFIILNVCYNRFFFHYRLNSVGRVLSIFQKGNFGKKSLGTTVVELSPIFPQKSEASERISVLLYARNITCFIYNYLKPCSLADFMKLCYYESYEKCLA